MYNLVHKNCVLWFLYQGGGQRRCHVLYIVDVISIHNELIGDKPFKERYCYCLCVYYIIVHLCVCACVCVCSILE